MAKILIIEDDRAISDIERDYLELSGFETDVAYDGVDGLNKALSGGFDLILLDLMLPGLSGEEILPEIREIPVIVVSAKAEVDDKVSLLMDGAEDYITKPFSVKELLARVEVQLRRGRPEAEPDVFRFRDLVLDAGKRTVRAGGVPVKLTKTEYAILKLLMRSPSQVMTKSVLLDEISNDSPDGVESSLKVHVSNLRRKLREAGGEDYIESVWGIGFKMREETS